GIEREVVARVHLDADEIANRVLIFCPVEALKGAVAWIRLGRLVDRLLERLDERDERVAAWLSRARRRHHFRPQRTNALLGDVGFVRRGVDVELPKGDVSLTRRRAVARGAVAPDDAVQRLGRYAPRSHALGPNVPARGRADAERDTSRGGYNPCEEK